MTFNLLLPPSFPPSIFPPVHHSRLISLSKWFLTPSISLQPIQTPASACGRCYALWQVKWKPREISSSYKRSKAFSQSKKKEVFFPFFLSCQQTGKRHGSLIWRPFDVFLDPQLISAPLHKMEQLNVYIQTRFCVISDLEMSLTIVRLNVWQFYILRISIQPPW